MRHNRLVDAMNRGCHCIGVNKEALRESLETGLRGSDVFAGLTNTHPNLLAEFPVFLSPDHVDRMMAIVAAVDSLVATWSAIGESCETDVFEPRTGPLCGWCPFAGGCTEGQAEIERRAARKAEEEAALLSLAG